MVALEGQHTAKLTNAFSKEVPSSNNRERIWSVFEAEAKSKSSVRTKRMLGRSVAGSASSSWAVSEAEASDPEQLVPKRRKTARPPTTIAKSVLLLALKALLPLVTIRELLPFLAGTFSKLRG